MLTMATDLSEETLMYVKFVFNYAKKNCNIVLVYNDIA